MVGISHAAILALSQGTGQLPPRSALPGSPLITGSQNPTFNVTLPEIPSRSTKKTGGTHYLWISRSSQHQGLSEAKGK